MASLSQYFLTDFWVYILIHTSMYNSYSSSRSFFFAEETSLESYNWPNAEKNDIDQEMPSPNWYICTTTSAPDDQGPLCKRW